MMKNCHNGFTLVDMMIALLLLTIGLLGMAKLTVAIIFGNQASNMVTKAAIVAESKMEDIRRSGYKGIAAVDTTNTDDFNEINNFPDFQRITAIYVDTPVEGLKTVTIKVNWRVRKRPKSMVISTMLTK
ncbi:prepilin-type N-terminal cleavage/methylation domain-containing protein [Desulfococcaceae bacterium HSG9]|nr:prepilin-type N-terminal cleavage/methylation domain-containing protein [Desulfococcaceae bacterium HSG9]